VNAPTDTTARLAAGNAAQLRQGLTLLERLSDAQYAGDSALFSRGGVGAHVRHVLEHYACFLEGLAAGAVDYDGRERERALERDRELARARIEQVLAALEALEEDPARPLEVALDAGGGDLRTTSSVARELQFLASHTVHHLALVAAMLRAAGCEPGADFGVAPSTLRFEQAGGLCAR
jgi:uncharacterized damage-inducible protein DinB